jgi:hypothetical protein
MITLLYLENATWEFDFIINEFLYNIEKATEILCLKDIPLLLNRQDIIEQNILVINTTCKADSIINIVKHIKPIAVFYLSDECGEDKNIPTLEKYTKLFFRQYNHRHYHYANNNYQLMLGYSKYFLTNQKSSDISPKKMMEREISCSFIGTMKSDRFHMTNVFKQNMENTNIVFVENNWNIDDLPYSPQKCFDIYNNSVFVICGRGNVSLDCFRIYEAIVAGAIPVVVGTRDEIKSTFYYQDHLPPFIYDDSWEKVVIKCNDLLKNDDELQKIQNELLLWWKEQISFVNQLIMKEIPL